MNVPQFVTFVRQFLLSVWERYHQNHCLQAAGNLAFTTVLSIIPVAIVMSSILLDFKHISDAFRLAQEYLLDKLIPSTAESVRELMPEITSTAENITFLSLLLLLTTSILLLRSIDETINIIWRLDGDGSVQKPFRLHYYLLVIVLAPVLLGLSLSITSYLSSLPFINNELRANLYEHYLLWLSPLCLNVITFSLLYKYSPRVTVTTKVALIGGVIAAVLFEAAKWLFSFYIVSFPNYQIIYGALSFIPIFLLWIYISWAIILFGAEVSYKIWVDSEGRQALKT